jgi:hypothetical protein
MTTSVSDARSNANEQIVHAAELLAGSAQRLQVFQAIYRGKTKVKSVDDIAKATSLTRKQVLNQGLVLAKNEVVHQVTKTEQVAYEKDGFYSGHKTKIERLAQHPEKIDRVPTKRNQAARVTGVVSMVMPKRAFDVDRMSIVDIDSFRRVRGVKLRNYVAIPLTEESFKKGVQGVVGEPGDFKDWGGESNDLWTTRVIVGGRRRAASMAFKGKGMTGKLTPKKMGKNGDQIQRLFVTPAELYVLQYWAEIDQSVYVQMNTFAIAVSAVNGGKKVRYCVIDGRDSQRLISAYPKAFPGGVT